MICTSSYKECGNSKFNTISISWDKGKDAGYIGDCISLLAPKLSFWNTWKKNRGIISEEENNQYYVNEYYKEVLLPLNPEEIYEILDNKILLCYEDNGEFCHRHIISAWLELTLGIEVPEVKIENDALVIEPAPEYIKEYLKNAMTKNDSQTLIRKK